MQTVHLQNVGNVPAVPAAAIRAGYRIQWNWGLFSTVISSEQRGKSMYTILEADGKLYNRRFLASRLVALLDGKHYVGHPGYTSAA